MLPVSAVISVLVLIATGDPGDGSTRRIEQALRSALGADAVIVVRTAAPVATDEALAAAAAAEETSLVGVVSWTDHQRRATLHFLTLPGGRWSDREIRFDGADAAAERGRTVGFALASMVPDDAMASRERPAEPPAAPPPPAPVVDAPPLSSPSTAKETGGSPARRMAVDASAVATAGMGGYGGGVGAILGFRLPLAGAFAARAAFGARAGEIGPAQASSRVISGGLGVAWQPWLDAPRRWAVGGRLDALVLHQSVSHFSADDPEPVSRGSFVPAIDAALEATFRFTDSAALAAALGTEAALGETDVVVKGRQVASLPPARVFAELGLRLLF